jgi:glycerol-3-phosphate acyltransferase PlsY
MISVLMLIFGYFLGSLSFSYFIARLAMGIDIRTVGSRNAGGHHVMLQVGRGWGSLAAALDAGNGALAAWLGLELGGSPAMGVLAGLAAVVGHNYPFYTLASVGGRD